MRRQRFEALIWLVPVLFSLHNLEEVLLMPSMIALPTWSPLARFSPGQFRLATIILTAAVAGIAMEAWGHGGRVAVFLLAGAQMTIFENALVHMVVSTALLRYTPGTMTAAFLTLPFTLAFFKRAIEAEVVRREQLPLFFLAGIALMPAAILLSLNLARLVAA